MTPDIEILKFGTLTLEGREGKSGDMTIGVNVDGFKLSIPDDGDFDPEVVREASTLLIMKTAVVILMESINKMEGEESLCEELIQGESCIRIVNKN